MADEVRDKEDRKSGEPRQTKSQGSDSSSRGESKPDWERRPKGK